MRFRFKILFGFLASVLVTTAEAGSFYIGIPLGVEGLRSADVNGSLNTEGIESIGDVASSSYGGGFGYEWDSGFRLGLKGSQTAVLDESEGSIFAHYSILRAGFTAEYPLVSGSMSFLDLGLTLGGALSRFTIIGNTLTGVAQKIDGYLEPSVSFKYGGKSTKFFFTASYPVLSGGEFKSFGNPGVTGLTGPGVAVVLGILIYLY